MWTFIEIGSKCRTQKNPRKDLQKVHKFYEWLHSKNSALHSYCKHWVQALFCTRWMARPFPALQSLLYRNLLKFLRNLMFIVYSKERFISTLFYTQLSRRFTRNFIFRLVYNTYLIGREGNNWIIEFCAKLNPTYRKAACFYLFNSWKASCF